MAKLVRPILLTIKDPNHPHLYKSADDRVLIGFGAIQSVTELDPLLPKALRGMSYEQVKTAPEIGEYFQLADLVLISAEKMREFVAAQDMTGVTKDNPATVRLPCVDLEYLRLRGDEGQLEPLKLREIYGVVAAYWEAEGRLAIEPGLVAALWRRGMAGADILRCIRASTGRDGKLIKASGRGNDIMAAVIDAYLGSKGLSSDVEISQAEMKDLIDRWLTATRSAALGSAEMQNAVLHWSEYRRLGLIDEAGIAQTDQVRLIAEKIFKFDTPLSFKQICAWTDQYHPPQAANARQTPKAARALLKKNRKKGKLNRKRGRR